MTPTPLEDLEARVRAVLEDARDALGRIEMEVRERGERRDLMESSRILAQYCMYARELLFSLQARRPAPQRFAGQVAGLRDQLAPHAAALAALGMRPSPADLGELARAAQAIPGAA